MTAFTICEGCGQVTEFHDTAIEQRLSALTRAQNFKTEKTTIEIRGHCQSCA
ncbi:zinc uptake transcriptional repressor [compost metagenome]